MVFAAVLTGLDGIFGGPVGLGGILGIKSRSTTGGARRGTVGADLVVRRGAFAACAASRSRLVGGKGGSFASPSAGGSFLCTPVSTEPQLVAEDSPDCPENVELSDIIDSSEPRRTN
jgi:hypothetical protein